MSAYIEHVKTLCQRRERDLDRHVAHPDVGAMLRVSTLPRQEFWEQSSASVPLTARASGTNAQETSTDELSTRPRTPETAFGSTGVSDAGVRLAENPNTTPTPFDDQISISQFLHHLVRKHELDEECSTTTNAEEEPENSVFPQSFDATDSLPITLLGSRSQGTSRIAPYYNFVHAAVLCWTLVSLYASPVLGSLLPRSCTSFFSR